MEHRLTSIVWRQYQPERIELVYGDGEKENIAGTYRDASRLADDAGMRRAPSALGSIRWTGDLPEKDGQRPKRIGPWLTT